MPCPMVIIWIFFQYVLQLYCNDAAKVSKSSKNVLFMTFISLAIEQDLVQVSYAAFQGHLLQTKQLTH